MPVFRSLEVNEKIIKGIEHEESVAHGAVPYAFIQYP